MEPIHFSCFTCLSCQQHHLSATLRKSSMIIDRSGISDETMLEMRASMIVAGAY